MYKVFFNDKVIYLTDKISNNKDNFICINSKKEIPQYIDLLKSDAKIENITLFNKNIEKLQNMFGSLFSNIEAAGGLVYNNENHLLFIFRRNKWDLPKGKIDENETPQQAAIREVAEETGLKNTSITKLLTHTYHTYTQNGTDILKKTYWYIMKNNTDQVLIPQYEEEISEVKWVCPRNLEIIRNNTYNSIIDVLSAGGL